MKATKRERELVAALVKFGRHWACDVPVTVWLDSNAKKCTCGLAAAITGKAGRHE